MSEQIIQAKLKPFIDEALKNGYCNYDTILRMSKTIALIHPGSGNVSRQLSEIVIKATMITNTTEDPIVKRDAGDCIAAASAISQQLGLDDAHELMMELTRLLDEHPEGWEGDCECKSCVEDNNR